MTVTVVRGLVIASLTTGVVCQFVQDTDPTPPLAYYTIDSAIFAAAVLVLLLLIRAQPLSHLQTIRGAATIGVLLSSVVYASVIAPASPNGSWFQPGDDSLVRVATVLLHGVGPILIIVDFLANPYPTTRPWRTALAWCGWPVLYFCAITALQLAGVVRIPYEFLDARRYGTSAFILAAALLAVISILIGCSLLAIQSRLRRSGSQ